MKPNPSTTDSVEWANKRLPLRDMIALPDVSAALNVNPKTITAWWEAGEVDGLDLGRGKKRTLNFSRSSLLDFIARRQIGQRQAVVTRPHQPELFPVAETNGIEGVKHEKENKAKGARNENET